MKSIFYSISLLLLTSASVTAQNNDAVFLQNEDAKTSGWSKFTDNLFASKWKPGVQAGINFNRFKITEQVQDYNKSRVGYNFGVFIDYTSNHFIFQPGLNYV